jgi:thiol-disulfide isomerase/thioredoxin
LPLPRHETSGTVKIVSFDELESMTAGKDSDTLLVINFWATWCKPCVEEMPFFESASKKFSGEKVKVIYMSLNSVKELNDVEAFIKKKNIDNPVFLLNAPNPNEWIDKIDSSWGGSIPATVMYRSGKKVFFKEGSFTQEEINSKISSHAK